MDKHPLGNNIFCVVRDKTIILTDEPEGKVVATIRLDSTVFSNLTKYVERLNWKADEERQPQRETA